MDKDALYSMDLQDFLAKVEGCLLWEEDRFNAHRDLHTSILESQLDWLSFFTANLMVSSGNYKRPDIMKMKEGLFQTEAAIKAAESVDVKKDVAAEKAKLIKRFNL